MDSDCGNPETAPRPPRRTRTPFLRVVSPLFVLAIVTFVPALSPAQPTPGQNVNMVSGKGWPGGDPFLQRQNEPSLALSSRNPLHLLAGANDYRTVDLNPADVLPGGSNAGDAWLGVFKSLDGGRTWESTLLPGFPQDNSAPGLASPIKGFTTAADPTVRGGTNGLFYYSGIAFNRGTNQGKVFVARFLDLDNKENGDVAAGTDPIKYVGTVGIDSGTGGQFLDKPYLAADIPRAGAATCTVNLTVNGSPVTQSFPGGKVYLAYTVLLGTGSNVHTKLQVARSTNCGASWSTLKVSEGTKVGQGSVIAIDPNSGAVYVAWREFGGGGAPGVIYVVKSTNGGLSFTKPKAVVSLPVFNPATPTAAAFFDQGTTGTSIRTNAFPAMAVDGGGRVYLAWSQRIAPNGDARITMKTSPDGLNWSTGAFQVDNGSLSDDLGGTFTRGHQFMPAMTFSGGKLMVLHYDQRFDHTLGLFTPNQSPGGGLTLVGGKYYKEQRLLRGELTAPGGQAQVFTPFFDDFGLSQRRHTIEVRVAQANPAAAPAFTSARVSQFRFGTKGGAEALDLLQLQVDPPMLPMFQKGTVPFFGDYIDLASPAFVRSGTGWAFATASAKAPVFYASWTTNQDVVPPVDPNTLLVDWTKYTPPISALNPGAGSNPSIFDPTQTVPACQPAFTGSRNQNIYSSRITQGLLVSSLQNAKPLSPSLQRAFVVDLENQTSADRTFRLTIPGPIPAGSFFSFVPAPTPLPPALPAPTTALDVTVGLRAAASRSVFAISNNPKASITVNVDEVTGPGGNLVPGGLSSFVVLNADGTVPALANPDGAPSGSNILAVELYNPNVTNPNVTNPNVTNTNVTNPNVTNPNVTNPNVTNPNVTNPNVTNTDIDNPNVTNPNVTNPNVTNPNVTNTEIENPNVTNPNVTNAPLSDATYTVTNTGNTSGSYHVKLVSVAPIPPDSNLQLLVNKSYKVLNSDGCQLFEQTQNTVVANVINPVFTNIADLGDSTITDPSVTNVTFSLAPGESALVTLRGTVPEATMEEIVQGTAPVVVGQAVNTDSPTNAPPIATPLFVTTTELPEGIVNSPYSATLAAIGGTAPYAWSLSAGSLPPGISLSSGGSISGTPTAGGTFNFTVQATDSAVPAQTDSRDLSLAVNSPNILFVSQPADSVGGQTMAPVTVRVVDQTNAPIPGASVSIAIDAAACPGAVLSGATTTLTNADGQGSFSTLSIDRGSSGYTLRAFLTSDPSVASVSTPFHVEGFCVVGSLASPRQWHTATRLSDGRVLVAGGSNAGGALASAEIYDPVTRAFTPTGSMETPRTLHSATLLPGGKVLVVGGGSGFEAGTVNTAELYDPVAGTFSPTASLVGNTRQMHGAALLNDGRVLVAGGYSNDLDPDIGGLDTAELYDPVAGTFSAAAGTMVHNRLGDFTTTLLPDGRVLLAGGYQNFVGGPAIDGELFDPATGTFSAASNTMSTFRGKQTETLLSDGRVLLAGGENDTGFLASSDLFDPSGSSFSASPSSLSIARRSHTGSRLANGRILMAGGQTTGSTTVSSAELYDPASGSSPTGSLGIARQMHTGTPLSDGTFLIVGGVGTSGAALSESELFFPSALLNITTTSIPTGFRDEPYTATLLTAAGTPPFTWTALSALPSGMVLTPGGLLAGTPTAFAGPTSVWVRVTDAAGNTDLATFPLYIVNSFSTNGDVTISGVQINGGVNQAVVTSGASLSVALNYTIKDDACPGCIEQIQVGFADGLPQTCAYNGVPGPSPGVSGSATISLTAPSIPGRYYIAFGRSAQFSCLTSFWDFAGAGKPGPSRYIGAIDVIDPMATNGPVTISNASINGFGRSAVVGDGSTYSLAVDFHIVSDVGCPGCIDQLELGLTTGLPETCAFNGTPGVSPGFTGSATVSLTAPLISGRYSIGFDRSQHFSCAQAIAIGAWWSSRPGASRTIGVIVVPEPGL